MIKTIYIVGPAGSGKSSFARCLAAALERSSSARSWPVADTSAPLVRWLAEILAAAPPQVQHEKGHEGLVAEWQAYILEHKEAYRSQLVRVGEVARSILAYALVANGERAGGRILTGLRKREEFPCGALVSPEHMPEFSSRAKVEGRIVIYVDRRGSVVEDGFEAEFYSALAHYRVVNTDSILSNEGLSYQAQMLAEKILKECA